MLEPEKQTQLLSVQALVPNEIGVYEPCKGLLVEVLERGTTIKHRNIRGSLPGSAVIEDGYEARPAYALYAEDSYIDLINGLTIFDGKVLRETAVTQKLVNQFQIPSDDMLRLAHRGDGSEIALPLASQRMKNYCRWWLDSVGKLFVCSQSTLLRSKNSQSHLRPYMPRFTAEHQRQTVSLLNWSPPITANGPNGVLRGRTMNTSGLTLGGGQSISPLIKRFAPLLDVLIPPTNVAAVDGHMIYISRNESSMRRVLNEDELLPGIRDLGFKILNPSTMPLSAQIDAFRNARTVLAPHGAGLTNIVFCRPGATLIEIFPEGGVHGSAFLRIASQLDFNYFFVVGQKIENSKSLKNPNNADIVLDKADFLRFVRTVVNAES
jgi:capsular polysaccharide biosynthesis protein